MLIFYFQRFEFTTSDRQEHVRTRVYKLKHNYNSESFPCDEILLSDVECRDARDVRNFLYMPIR